MKLNYKGFLEMRLNEQTFSLPDLMFPDPLNLSLYCSLHTRTVHMNKDTQVHIRARKHILVCLRLDTINSHEHSTYSNTDARKVISLQTTVHCEPQLSATESEFALQSCCLLFRQFNFQS